jgi:hypothetical protein
VRVDNLSPGVGTALYNGDDWQLVYAVFPTFDDMMAFSAPIASGAIAIVGVGLGTAPVYFYDGDGWVRTPEGTGYVHHPDVEDWEALDGILDPKDGDQVAVTSIATGTSNGVAKWSDADSIWKLFRADFGSFTDMVNFNESIWPNAIASPDDGSKNAPWYMYSLDDESWLRLPDGTGYVYNFPSPIPLEEFSLLVDPKETDRVLFNTGYGTPGWAVYESGDWYFDQGTFPTVANMTSFLTDLDAIDVKVGATARVPAVAGATDAEHIHYVYVETPTPAWVRAPLDTHYIWPQVANWAELLSTRPYGQPSDEVHVHSLGSAHSNGTAQMHGGTWKLIEGKWTSVTDMNNWANVPLGRIVHSGAIALIDPAHHYDEDSSAYYYTGSAWQQLGVAGVTKVYTITSLRDFTASGLTEGDYGLYGNTVYRYKAAVSVTGGGVTPMWLPPAVYAGTPTVRAQLVGTEAIGALPVTVNGVTFAVVQNASAGSTVTQAGDYIQFQTATSTGNIIHGTALYTMGSTVRNYMQVEISVTYTSTSGAITRIFASEGSGQPAWYFHLGPSGSISPLPYFAAGTTLQGSQEAIRDGGIAFPSNASGNYTMTEFVDSGRNVAAECFMNGISYARSRRSSTTTGFVTPGAGVGFYMQANSFGAGGTMTTRIRNWRVITW